MAAYQSNDLLLHPHADDPDVEVGWRRDDQGRWHCQRQTATGWRADVNDRSWITDSLVEQIEARDGRVLRPSKRLPRRARSRP